MKLNARQLSVIGLTAAVYVVATVALPFLSYGSIQCRLSEVLNLLAFVNPIFAPGVVLGCFIANIFSPNGIIDCFVGTFATACAVYAITKSKNLFVASLWPTIFNAVFIGLEIFIITGPPFLLSKFLFFGFTVMIGEFLAVTVIGYPLFKLLSNRLNFLKEI